MVDMCITIVSLSAVIAASIRVEKILESTGLPGGEMRVHRNGHSAI